MRSSVDTPPALPGAASRCSPATLASRMSSAWRSGTSVSSSVTGAPATRSPLTMRVPPRRAHSVENRPDRCVLRVQA